MRAPALLALLAGLTWACGSGGGASGSGGSAGFSAQAGSGGTGGSVGTGGAAGTHGPVCGDGLREGDEECDGTDLADQSCYSLGYSHGGILGCTAQCHFDIALCVGEPG